MSEQTPPRFLRKFQYREHSTGWAVPCPDKHGSAGFAVIVSADDNAGRWRFACVDADHGDLCGNERDLVRLLGLTERDLHLGADGEDGPVFVDLREITMRDIVWIDKPFLPTAELVTVNADGDTGKGLLSVHWAARISRGEFGNPRMVVFVVAEDAFDTVLKPRLVAGGANLEHILALGWRRAGTEDALRIPDDIAVLEQHIASMNVRMMVIDPLLSHLSAKTNSHTDHEVKLALKPLMTLAHNTGCVVLGLGHFGKDKTGGARKASMGSTAFTNTPRVGMAMAHDDEDPDLRVLEVIKSNISPKGVGRNYRIRAVEVDGLKDPVPMLVAEGAATKAVDDLIAKTQRGKHIPGELVRELILAELGTGEKSRKHLDAVALDKLAANPDTLYRGLEALRKDNRVKPRKDGSDGVWYWRLSLEEQVG